VKLGLQLGYWTRGPAPGTLEMILEAERLGFDSAWTAEAYGSDALTPLAWWGAHTERIKLGTAIMQLSARAPTATAMAAMSLDHLSGGRFIAGLGVSGPQVVEGWYGAPFAKPLARTREYVGIMRQVFAREAPVTNDGPHYPLPLTADGLGKPLKPSIHPFRDGPPIYLAAEGPKNIALAGELCDGWLALFFSPEQDDWYRRVLGDIGPDFEVAATVPLVLGDDLEAAADTLRPMYALYFGGMGAKAANFHADVAARMGYAGEVETIQALYLEGRKDEAAAALPFDLIDQLALLGPPDRVRGRLDAWHESVVTTLLIAGSPETLRTAAELVL
jgi:F420-dependent oxidoreductase-like protein